MKAEELRIGNLIIADGEETQVYALYEYDERGINGVGEHYEAGQYTYPVCEPIPLTEEWLLRFGFAKNYGEFTKGNLMLDCEYTDKGEYVVKYGKAYIEADIKYVHHLQNLYFALTGDELTIKK